MKFAATWILLVLGDIIERLPFNTYQVYNWLLIKSSDIQGGIRGKWWPWKEPSRERLDELNQYRVINPGIAAYEHEMNMISSWMQDWIHQDHFDKKVREFEENPRIFPRALTGATFLLAPFQPGAQLLHLLQLMVEDGLIEQKGKIGNIYYKAASNGNTSDDRRSRQLG